MRRHTLIAWAIAATAGGFALPATAFQAPEQAALGAARGASASNASPVRLAFELFDGTLARSHRLTVWDKAPPPADRLFHRFLKEPGAGQWRASWDQSTQTVARLYGPGLAAPGSIASGTIAEQVARDLLERHIALFAPGASPNDFTLVSNDLDTGIRSLGYVQSAKGLSVKGGQLSFRFKHDRLVMIAVETLPNVDVKIPTTPLSDELVRAAAKAWVGSGDAFGAGRTGLTDGPPSEPFVLPIRTASGVRYAVVREVVVEATHPVGRWSVYLDAHSGTPLAREQTLRFAEATVELDAPVRYPAAGRALYPARDLEAVVDGIGLLTTDASGTLAFDDTAVEHLLRLQGPYVQVKSTLGAEIEWPFELIDGQSIVLGAADIEPEDAQINVFVHTDLVKERARKIAPELTSWLDQRMTANVNINDSCNAYFDGFSINFFRASNGCANTGRIADVVYHEFGHALHHAAVIPGVGEAEGALGEGVSDYLAATMTGDPGTARGFFFDDQPLRHIDPEGFEHRFPNDLVGEVHYDGLIIAGALWDLRKILIEKYGEQEGVELTDHFFFQGVRRAVDIPSMYMEILLTDDDDGDLSNGSPNVCEISEAFGLHGLRAIGASINDLSVADPVQDDYEVSISVKGLFAQCPSDAISGSWLNWRRTDSHAVSGNEPMVESGDGFTGAIPGQTPGTAMEFGVTVALGAGPNIIFPDNAADRWYQFYVGEVVPLYCTDFESDPLAEGWSHLLKQGESTEGADDWEWGAPNGTPINGDPMMAFSGERVFGNDLGNKTNHDGLYQNDKVNAAISPMIDIQGFEHVRLQYRRWLNVEDAYYDRATIFANETQVWQNFNSQMGEASSTHHTDREWRFADIDISEAVKGSDTVEVRFEVASDQGLSLGGWNIDDFCVVGVEAKSSDAPCLTCDDPPVGIGRAPADADSPADVDDGCGCRAVGTEEPSSHRGWLVLLGAAAVAGFRKRTRSVQARKR